ncbi:hypothetical protein M3650_02745 [Paenibacillus sp. MER TA 81-3]|uniref:hypothetical protein n=1 Tax=Paenibacillus sp. MER TA 81-3 TaxID=2939573 RepID=UPI00203ACF8B|nr:hypothetical protein [Paenibacillus sp. MER TA 81-3]MCM3337590.1 hypothetical protein [Paenibacillus sp. MER TA 81-3]
MNDTYTWLFTVWMITIGVVMLFTQVYVSRLLYRYEKSVLWGCIGFILLFGLNMYVYQIIKLEKRAGYAFERLDPQARKVWRRVYVLILIQYLLFFVFFGWLSSPG